MADSDLEPLRSGAAALPSSSDPESPYTPRGNRVRELLRNLDRRLSSRGRQNHADSGAASPAEAGTPRREEESDELGDGAPPEWALLLVGCLLGLATGIFVAAFNRGVHVIHEWAWAGTPTEGAAWLRLQRLADTWHRILLIPVTGGVVVGMMHGLMEIFEQIKQSLSSQREGIDFMSAIFPTIKAIQAAITLGTGCSLGPEGPSVDIGKSCAIGCAEMMENNRERRIALIAAGSAAGIASGFNAAVAGCFFAIETVLRPLRAENSPPFTTAMIILASVISSTVSNVLLGEKAAFIVPTYELKSAAGNTAVAHPQAYALVGMAATLASVCSVPLTSVLLLFELTKDYRILLPLMGAVGLAIWVPSVLSHSSNKEMFEATSPRHGYSSLLPPAERSETDGRRPDADDVELAILEDDYYGSNSEEMLLDELKVSRAMTKHFIKVIPTVTIKEATLLMHDKQQGCVLVVDNEDFLEGIVTVGDIRRKGFEPSEDANSTGGNSSVLDVNSSPVTSCLTRGFQYHGNERGLVTCFPDTDLSTAKVLMEVKGIKQLPVVKRGAGRRNDGRRKVLGLLHYESIGRCLREELERWKAIYQREFPAASS
ncbi:unnamed protein product [Alopecurus aequalis]